MQAGVEIDGATVASIGRGMLALVGIHRDDTDADIEYIAGKLLGLRIFDDGSGVMNQTLSETGGGLRLVSQFTLYGDARKGRRPSYSGAMPPGPGGRCSTVSSPAAVRSTGRGTRGCSGRR